MLVVVRASFFAVIMLMVVVVTGVVMTLVLFVFIKLYRIVSLVE